MTALAHRRVEPLREPRSQPAPAPPAPRWEIDAGAFAQPSFPTPEAAPSGPYVPGPPRAEALHDAVEQGRAVLPPILASEWERIGEEATAPDRARGQRVRLLTDYARTAEVSPAAPAPAPAGACSPPGVDARTFEALLRALQAAGGDRDRRRDAAVQLATWCRANLVDAALVQRYLARPDVTNEQKTATMGQLAALVARSEFLLGVGWSGGTEDSMETSDNGGPFPEYYQKRTGFGGKGEWCTMFAGEAHLRAGFQPQGPRGTHPFFSGPRLDLWASTGKDMSLSQTTAPGDTVGAEGSSGVYVDGSKWRELARSLAKAAPADRGGVVDAFVRARGEPRPGDILTVGKGHDHTVLVDRYDPATRTVYTIEGNVAKRVGARSFSLLDPAWVGTVGCLVRPRAEMYMTPETKARLAAPQAKPRATPADAPSPERLTAPLRYAIERLAATTAEAGWTKSGRADATAYEWRHGDRNVRTDRASTR